MELTELENWIARQTVRSTTLMERAISAAQLCRRRHVGKGQVIRPARGSVLASPEIADWNPEPDYFFHWLRDSAIVMRTVADLMEDAAGEPERRRWAAHFEDFVGFSLTLKACDGRAMLAERGERIAHGRSDKFLRPDAELSALTGDALLGEPRFNPDGTIDVFRWSRPQYDGPALRALACLRFLAAGGASSPQLLTLLQGDLDFTVRYAGHPCIGPWEEPNQNGWHYYVELAQFAALSRGRTNGAGDDWPLAEQTLRRDLEQYWSERHRVLMAVRPAAAQSADDLIDAATLLAVWDADLPDGPHSVLDPRVQKTQEAIEALFARELPINCSHAGAPLLGRSRGDRYFGGGAWYPTTLAAAGLCYRLARLCPDGRQVNFARGDAFMTAIMQFTPADGSLSEQIDRTTGMQTSARHLTWSYAAFISTARERRLASPLVSQAAGHANSHQSGYRSLNVSTDHQ